MIARATSSLRIAHLAVENFRTFHERVVIPLSTGAVADEVAVFHGGNGAGKSNALAALDLFFRAASYWLRGQKPLLRQDRPLEWDVGEAPFGVLAAYRDWPPGNRRPMRIEVRFAANDAPITATFTPAGNDCILRFSGLLGPSPDRSERMTAEKVGQIQEVEETLIASARNRIDTPFGRDSTPLFRLDARRRIHRSSRGKVGVSTAPESPFSLDLAERVLALATSLEPIETERWRAFTSLLSRFKTFAGREVSVLRLGDGSVDLRLEIRGKQILRVSELSSGEQQVVALCAAVLTSRAAIVAIEEPEISLHPDYQTLVHDVLREQVRSGLIDQMILESHVPIFDGPEVVRFSRSAEGATSVVRQASDADDPLRALARKSGAEPQWVTPEGYTQLPEEMIEKLGFHGGGHLWFLRSKAEGRWEAWTAADLDRMFGLPGTAVES